MWEYTDKVREHFINPRNVGAIENADAIGEVGSLSCGDALKLYLKIDDGVITRATFQTFGCASAIASSSILTELVVGKTLDEALLVSNKEIAEALGGLPKEKMHCSVMGQEALEAAIRGYRGEPATPHTHEGRLVCKCFGVTEEQIVKAITSNNLTTAEEVTHYTKAGGGCGECVEEITRILTATLAGVSARTTALPLAGAPAGLGDFRKKEALPEPAKPALSNIQRMQQVMTVIAEVIRPRLQQDGGDIELVDISGKEVSVALRGNCTSCPSSRITIEGFVQRTLQDNVEPGLTVKEVQG